MAGYAVPETTRAYGALLVNAAGEVVTGLLYVDSDPTDLHGYLNTVAAPLNGLGEKELCPGSATLDKINASLR